MEDVQRRVRVRIDRDRCVGSTICVQVTPGVFALDERRQSTVTDPDGAGPDEILKAAEECPVSAIIVEDATTGERLFP
ncbi:MAG: ferredoxin [Planctomycetota bacterium]|jgi:ferredoxin